MCWSCSTMGSNTSDCWAPTWQRWRTVQNYCWVLRLCHYLIHYDSKWNWRWSWFIIGVLDVSSGIQITETVLYYIMETARGWTLGVDNAHQTVNFFKIDSLWAVAFLSDKAFGWWRLLSLKCELQQFAWPKMPILPNTGEYSVTSQKDVLSNVERNSVTSLEDALVNSEESSVTLHTTEFWESMPPNCTCTFCTFMVYVEHEWSVQYEFKIQIQYVCVYKLRKQVGTRFEWQSTIPWTGLPVFKLWRTFKTFSHKKQTQIQPWHRQWHRQHQQASLPQCPAPGKKGESH